ncbi:hypothetical protein ACFP3U_21965 [Kitasatospora misakiensis]|uniref:Uncharacterized protein n=1 Tax=Kitasatospora misakiensis TaxID=67330 RepID=A0ABW0X7B3_9ACTN
MRSSRKVWAVVAGVLVLALGVGGFVSWQYPNLFLPDRLCDNAVAAKDAERVLGDGKIVVASHRASSDRNDPDAYCAISLKRGGKYVAEIHLRTKMAAPFEPSLRADPAMSQPDRGAVGAFGNSRGWLLMAPGCRLASKDAESYPDRDADAVAVDVTRDKQPDPYRSAHADATASPEARQDLARLAAGFAAAVAHRSGCGSAAALDVHLATGGQVEQPVVDGQLCGVPGAAAVGRIQPDLRQDVSSPSAPVQSCWIYGDNRSTPAYRFTGTLDTRYPKFAVLSAGSGPLGPLPAGWRGTGRNNLVVAPCGTGSLTLDAFRSSTEERGVPAIETPAFRAWANAMASKYGCEPVAPK